MNSLYGLTLAVLFSLPFIYNACSPLGRSATAGSGSYDGASCGGLRRVVIENGQVVIRAAAPPAHRSPFAFRKAVLGDAAIPVKGQSVGSAQTYPAGTELAVIVSGACLAGDPAQFADTLISRDILRSNELNPSLDDQAVGWTLPSAMTEAELDQIAAGESCVKGVSFNHHYQTESLALNDSMRGNQSYLAFDQADAAYNLAYGAGGMPISGPSVTVAVLDSGIDYKHPDLVGKIAAGNGMDVANNTNDPVDISSIGHGTHVSGMIAAASNNTIGISGVVPFRAQILAVRIFKNADGATSSQQVYTGVQYAISRGASVINLSIAQVVQGAQSDSVLQQAMQNAVAANITVVIAMGNSGTLADGVNVSTLPAQYSVIDGVLGVGAVNAADGQKSTFSTYGTKYAEISAVGAESGSDGILSTVPTWLNNYGRLAGTSQATPQVTAAAALAIAMIRNAYGASPDPSAIETLIKDSADKRPELLSYFRDGNRLNLLNLVQLVRQRYPLTATGKSTGC